MQVARKIHIERISRRGLSDCRCTAGSRLLRCLRNEAVRYLIDVGIELLQMHTVRSRIRQIDKETGGQLALDTEVPLLYVSVFLERIGGR